MRREQTTGSFNCSGYAQGVAQVLQLKESDLGRYLHGTGLPRDVLYAGSEVHMDVDDFLRVIENAKQMVDDPEVGLRCGQNLQRSVHGPIGFLSMNAPDLFSALMTPAQFAPLRLPLLDTRLSFDADWLNCEMQVRAGLPEDTQRILLEAFALTLQANVEAYLGAPLTQGNFTFAYPRPAHHASYPHYFHIPVSFEGTSHVLRLPAEMAREAKPDQDPQAYAAAHQLCTELLNRIPDTSLDIDNRIRRLLLSHSIGAMTEDDVSRALFISKRTLARRLAARGQSYRQLRETLLAELSARYLTEDRLSVDATANLLGYHDAANFRRAFRRWHQMTPTEFRDRLST